MTRLTRAEERIMRILWQLEKGFVKDIRAHFPDPKPPPSSVSTIVRVLVRKRIVGYTAYGGSHRYHPLVSREEYRTGQARDLLATWFEGSVPELLAALQEPPPKSRPDSVRKQQKPKKKKGKKKRKDL
ncbi:MAG: BlaI/MecI/CopY family transcriptional regulator [Bacteroidales bacterium]